MRERRNVTGRLKDRAFKVTDEDFLINPTDSQAMRPAVRGIELDGETRCAHYNSPLDIVAIKMKCCGEYFACKECHAVLADHALEAWPRDESHRRAILCGACGCELTIAEYLESSDRCLACDAPFNPGCRVHRGYYFRPDEGAGEL